MKFKYQIIKLTLSSAVCFALGGTFVYYDSEYYAAKKLKEYKEFYADKYIAYSNKLGVEPLEKNEIISILDKNIKKINLNTSFNEPDIAGSYTPFPNSKDYKVVSFCDYYNNRKLQVHELGHAFATPIDSATFVMPFDTTKINLDIVDNMQFGTKGVWNTAFIRGKGEFFRFGIDFNEGINDFIACKMLGKSLYESSYAEQVKTVALLSADFGEDTIFLSYRKPEILEQKYEKEMGKNSFSRLLFEIDKKSMGMEIDFEPNHKIIEIIANKIDSIKNYSDEKNVAKILNNLTKVIKENNYNDLEFVSELLLAKFERKIKESKTRNKFR